MIFSKGFLPGKIFSGGGGPTLKLLILRMLYQKWTFLSPLLYVGRFTYPELKKPLHFFEDGFLQKKNIPLLFPTFLYVKMNRPLPHGLEEIFW